MAHQPQDRASTGRDSLIGERIGQYRLVREIGRGGMGVVYEAVHESIGQRAAVKVLAGTGGGGLPSASSLRRFVAEARALSAIEHPGIVRIFDFGDIERGLPYLLMEYLDGERLRDRLERIAAAGSGRLPVAESLRIARQIASAVAGAHRRGIVHRDLKPENVMLVADDEASGGERVRLLDFGIAKLEGAEGPRTAEGTVLGTAAYMAPEQCLGDVAVDDRADVYALGVILYELLAGALPFSGDAVSLMRQHLNREAPLLGPRAPLVAEGVGQLVAGMMAKEPSLRPRMDEVVERLRLLENGAAEDEAAGRPASSTPPETGADRSGTITASTLPSKQPTPSALSTARRRWGRRQLWTWLAAGAAAAAGIAGVRSMRRSPARPLAAMVHFPGGRFIMGSTEAEVADECAHQPGGCTESLRQRFAREQPTRAVTLSPFYLDIDEVTNEKFAAFLSPLAPRALAVREDSDQHYARYVHDRKTGLLLIDLSREIGGIERTADQAHFAARSGRARWPVAQVTWDGASQYCKSLGKRLPTEAEWEYAARGTSRRRFPWGEAAPRCDGVVFGRGMPTGCPGQSPVPDEVGTAPQDVTPEGVRGLGGNVGEWVQDQFILPYYADCGDCKDPVAEQAVPFAEDFRMFRGGAFEAEPYLSRSSTRSRWKRGEVMTGIGVRCASQ